MDKKLTLWRSSLFRSKGIPLPNSQIQSIEKTIAYTASFSFVAFIGATVASWQFHPDFFPLPLPSAENHIDSEYLTHLSFWIKESFHFLLRNQMPLSHANYLEYRNKLADVGMSYTLYSRIVFGALASFYAGYEGWKLSLKNPVAGTAEIHVEGALIYENDEAEKQLNTFWLEEYKMFDQAVTKFANLGMNLFIPELRRRTHSFFVGNSGSGKSQILQEIIWASILAKLKTVILDPKSEWIKALLNPDDPTICLLDPTDARGICWNIFADLRTDGMILAFVASIIPSGADGKSDMWITAAREVCFTLIKYLKNTFGDNATMKDMADVIQSTEQEIAHIVNITHPIANILVGKLREDGEVESNVTNSGIMINMISKMGFFLDLAKYWNDPNARQISLYDFMSKPDYPIKTIIIRPNEAEGRMARGITATALAYMINFIKLPMIYGSDSHPVGNFILDEFQSPGKIEDSNNDPVLQTVIQQGRSFGWGCHFATQTLDEAMRIYSKEIVNGWRNTVSTQILAGAPLGESLNSWIDMFGDKKIEKLHVSGGNGDAGNTSNWQEHLSKVMLPTTLTKKLQNVGSEIRYLIVPNGAKDLYFLRKTYKAIPKLYPAIIDAKVGSNVIDNSSRVRKALKTLINGGSEKAVKQEPIQQRSIEDLEREFEESDGLDFNFEDNGQYADDNSNQSQPPGEVYDITPDEESDEDDVAEGMIADHVTEVMLGDAQSINAVRNILEVFMSSKRITTTDKNEKLKFDANRKNKYSEMLECKY